MSEKLVTYSIQHGIAHIGLNDQNHLNALSKALVKDLNAAVDMATNDTSIFAILIYGHGKAFCVGGDLKEFVNIQAEPLEDFITSWEYIGQCALPVKKAMKNDYAFERKTFYEMASSLKAQQRIQQFLNRE